MRKREAREIRPVAQVPARRHPVWRTIAWSAIPAILLAAFLARGVERNFHGNWSALFYFGSVWSRGGDLPRRPIVREGPGYDGQFYYRVAQRPLLPLARLKSGERTERVPGIDTAWYRYRRIAYPLAARFAAFGSVDALVWGFPVVSVLSLWLGVFATWRLFESFGWPGYWGFSYALLPGLVFAASRNLCEGLAISLVVAAIVAIVRRRTLAGIGFLTVAHLAHETTLFVSAGYLAHAVWSRRAWREAAPFLLPIAAVGLWSAIVAIAFGASADSLLSATGGGGGLGPPLDGIRHKLQWLVSPAHAVADYRYLPTNRRFWRQEALLMLPIVLALFVLVREGWRRQAETWPAAVMVSLFIVSGSDAVWRDAASYARVTSLGLLLALRSVAGGPGIAGYAFVASLPFGAWGAFGWCWDNWRGWALVVR